MKGGVLDNGAIAELLARESEKASHLVQKALRRVARLAFIWPEEAAALLAQKRSLRELPGVGLHERIIRTWIEDPLDATGHLDFVLANPSFNVNVVDKEWLKDMVAANRQFPFGLPRTDTAN